MAVRTRIDSIAADIDLIVSDLLSPEAQSRAVAEFARGAIAEADETNRSVLGRVPPRVITVDGNPGAALETVRPVGGSIIVEWELIGDVMIWIGQTLRDRSPVGPSGNYRDGHTLLADGKEVPIGVEVPIASEYYFLNSVPYARKIEVGKTKSGRDFVISVPNRIYERTAKDAKARFGNMVNIYFTYRSPFIRYVRGGRGREGRSIMRNGDMSHVNLAMKYEKSTRVPAILVMPKAA